jgi:hypothetical protein
LLPTIAPLLCGRTGTLFAYEQYGIEPDIMTLGKGLGGGVPISALLAKQSCSCFEYGDQVGTFCGTPLVSAAGVAVIQSLLSGDFLETSRRIANLLSNGLIELSKEFNLGEVRGRGALLALELGSDVGQKVVTAARDMGLPLAHKHLPEIQKYSGLINPPVFSPSVGRYAQGMIVEIPLHLWALPNRVTSSEFHKSLSDAYAGSQFVEVASEEEIVAMQKLRTNANG